MIQQIRDFLMMTDIYLADIQRLFNKEVVVKTATCGEKILTRELIYKLNKATGNSIKIARIKLLRELTNYSLKEAKEIVEEVWESGKDNIFGYGPIKQKYR